MGSDPLNSNTSYAREFGFEQACLTDVGKRRSENQDSYALAHTKSSSLYLVADGMGGAKGGATASSLAVEIITRLAFDAEGKISEKTLSSAILRANEVIADFSKANKDCDGMGTTLVALAFVGRKAIVAHVGDSRIYQYKSNELVQLTKDHSILQELIDSGTVKSGNAHEAHPMGHVLTRSLGPMDNLEIEIRSTDNINVGELFLLCCDGFSNHAKEDVIKGLLKEKTDLDQIAKACVLQALQDGGSDNISVIVVKLLCLGDKKSIPFPLDNKPQVEVVSERKFSEREIEELLQNKSEARDPSTNEDNLNANIFQEILESEKNLAVEESFDEDPNSKRYLFLFILLLVLLGSCLVFLYPRFFGKNSSDLVKQEVSKNIVAKTETMPKLSTKEETRQEQAKRRSSLFTWQQEKPKKLSKAEQKKKLATEVAEKIAPDFVEKTASKQSVLLTDEEKQKIVKEKKKLRSELADTDLRLLMLSMKSEKEASQEVDALKSKVNLLKNQIQQVKKQAGQVSAVLSELKDPMLSLSSEKIFSFAKRIAQKDRAIAEALSSYQAEENEYRKSKVDWEKNPETQQDNAAKIAAQGRVARVAREKLFALVNLHLANLKTNLEKAEADSKFLLRDLEEELANANRHIGFWSAFRPMPKRLLRERRSSLVEKREEILRKLLDLRLQVPDEAERGII